MRKYGAPATSHVRLITAEDVDALKTVSDELRKTEKSLINETKKKNNNTKKSKDAKNEHQIDSIGKSDGNGNPAQNS